MIKLNYEEVKFSTFPNGETHLSKEKLNSLGMFKVNTLELFYENDTDLIHLLFLKDHLDQLNLVTDLIIQYMPYSRMDRTEGSTIFTLKTVCKFINDMKFRSVTIHEPHSDVCVALLDRVSVINMTSELVINYAAIRDNTYLVYPDAGAEKRYSKQIKHDKILTCSKERDFETGFIKRLDINGEVPTEQFEAIIVDDLCSKGGTFILTAQKLREAGATNITLVVAHCEKTILDGEILKTDLIDKVITSDSILKFEDIAGKNTKIKIYNVGMGYINV